MGTSGYLEVTLHVTYVAHNPATARYCAVPGVSSGSLRHKCELRSPFGSDGDVESELGNREGVRHRIFIGHNHLHLFARRSGEQVRRAFAIRAYVGRLRALRRRNVLDGEVDDLCGT